MFQKIVIFFVGNEDNLKAMILQTGCHFERASYSLIIGKSFNKVFALNSCLIYKFLMQDLNERLIVASKAQSEDKPEATLEEFYRIRLKLLKHTNRIYYLCLMRSFLQMTYICIWAGQI